MKTLTNLKLAAIVVMGFFINTTNAQNVNDNTVSFGIRGGIQWNNFNQFALDNSNGDRLTAFNAGLTGIFSSNQHWAIGADLNYARQGGNYTTIVKTPENSKAQEIRIYADYIRLTPKGYYFFGDVDNKFRPKLMVGPSLGVLAMAKTRAGNSHRDDFKPIDISAVIGTGFNYKLDKAVWFTMDVEYMMGLTKVNKNDIIKPADGLKNNSFIVDLGLAIGLTRYDK